MEKRGRYIKRKRSVHGGLKCSLVMFLFASGYFPSDSILPLQVSFCHHHLCVLVCK